MESIIDSEIKPDIELWPHQVEHVKKIKEILVGRRSLSCLDTSDRGHGKTFTSMFIAKEFQQKYGWNIVVIAPNDQCLNQTNGWHYLAKKHGINIAWSTTYSTLIGRNGKTSHGYLYCSKEDKSYYEATDKLKNLCKGGLLLILDECHKATRVTRTHWACSALVRACYKYKTMCRALHISNTPGDKPDHAVQLLRILGFMRDKKLVQYEPGTYTYNWEDHGLGEAMLAAKLFTRNEDLVDGCWITMRKGAAKKICVNLYKDCIGPLVTTAMTPPVMKAKFKATNAFLISDEESVDMLNQGLSKLSSAVRWNGEDVGEKKEWSLGGITIGLKLIERSKLKPIARMVRNRLKKDPKRKFVISVGARGIVHQDWIRKMIPIYSLPFEKFRAIYQCWKRNPSWNKISKDSFRKIISYMTSDPSNIRYPTVMNGKVKPKDRVRIMDEFQSDTNDCNVLIISPGVGSEAISLHDLHGTRPRTMCMIPDYFHTRLIQGTGRVYRVGCKSDAEVLMIYSKQGNLETSILNSMARKTKVAKEMLAVGQEAFFPADYPYWIEGEKDPELEQILEALKMKKK